MKFGFAIVQEGGRTGRVSRGLPLFLLALVVLLYTGCSRGPDSAPVPPGKAMSPAQAATARVQVINNDSRLTPLQKQQAIQRLQGQFQPDRPTAP